MRLLEFVTCCRAAAAPAADSPVEQSETAARIFEEETRSLMQRGRILRRRKRGTLGAALTAEEWKPSLFSISEDADTAVAVERIDREVQEHVDRAAKSERPVKRKSSRSIVSVYSGDDRRPTFQTVMPAFSPSPFMF